MLVKDEGGRGFWIGLGILGAGILIGYLARPLRWASETPEAGPATIRPAGDEPAATGELAPHLLRNEDPPPPPANGLATLTFDIPEASARTLQEVRDRGLERGVILQTPEDTVPAQVALNDGELLDAEIRIKGDWTDHIDTDKWSLRVTLDTKRLLGMRVFSIQAPKTRGMLWEWIVHRAGVELDVLAPRSTFVNVVINGNPSGVYFLEEHFSKEMVEAQGRREGPIVLWDESTHWAVLLHKARVPSKEIDLPMSRTLAPAHSIGSSRIRAYGEKRLTSIESLSSMLFAAVEKMRALRAQGVLAQDANGRLRALQALDELQGRTIEELIDVERLARMHALASLFQINHSLIWHNMRFYHNPLIDRLEPILFDNMPHEISAREPVPFRARNLTAEFARSNAYYDGLYRWMGRLCAPGWIDDLFARLEPELSRFEAALNAEEPLAPRFGSESMKQRLRAQAIFLRKLMFPPDAVNFEATYELDDSDAAVLSGALEVVAWATTLSPIVIGGFRFSNGSVVPAREALGDEPLALQGAHLVEDGVVLPYDGRPVAFRFDLNERLANLETVQQLKDAVRSAARSKGALDLDIDVLYRPIAGRESAAEVLVFRPRDPRWSATSGRPAEPSLSALLERHPFLIHDPARGRVEVHPGDWDVEGDLILPAGIQLHLTGGTRLRFEQDAILLSSSPLFFRGAPGAPVVLEPRSPAESWKGVCVLDADGRSEWENVIVTNTDAVARGGWVLTGGITFYRSPVTLRRTRIEGTRAEDGMNVFGTDFLFEEVEFVGCASDSFDGDFVTGELRNCVFRDGAADGVDFSGSSVNVVDCRFVDLGDKAVSVGEDSRVQVVGGQAENVSIGVAAKDRSHVEIEGFSIRNARNYALAAFIKKPEFGPCTLVARGVEITGSGRGDTLSQTDCVLEIDGQPVATQDLDVDRLYREKILGQ